MAPSEKKGKNTGKGKKEAAPATPAAAATPAGAAAGAAGTSAAGGNASKATPTQATPGTVKTEAAKQGVGKGKRVSLEPPASEQGGKKLKKEEQAAPTKEEKGPTRKVGLFTLPLDIDEKVKTLYRDGEHYTARVIERRAIEGVTDPTVFEYYVHFLPFNRRMDEWVTEEMMDFTVPPDDSDELHEDHGDFDPVSLREHEELTKVKNIDCIELGKHEMETWYFSPFPEEYNSCKKLYFCEYTLQFFKRREQMLRHIRKTQIRHPPGDEIYRNGNVSMFEIDGKKEKMYCQNLCFMAKLFLDHKTLHYDVDWFLFYVLCECDERGTHFVGYFSKEKCSEDGYNLACILTLPAYQRKGYGKFLISMSYELSKLEGRVGTPERPLSDLGESAYLNYWTRVILNMLRDRCGESISIQELSEMTSIKTDDIIRTLQHLNLIQYHKGQHVICAAPALVDQLLKKAGSPGTVVDPTKIIWSPYDPNAEMANFKR